MSEAQLRWTAERAKAHPAPTCPLHFHVPWGKLGRVTGSSQLAGRAREGACHFLTEGAKNKAPRDGGEPPAAGDRPRGKWSCLALDHCSVKHACHGGRGAGLQLQPLCELSWSVCRRHTEVWGAGEGRWLVRRTSTLTTPEQVPGWRRPPAGPFSRRWAASHERAARWDVLVPSMFSVSGRVPRLCLHSPFRGKSRKPGAGAGMFCLGNHWCPGESPALAAVCRPGAVQASG